MFATAKRRMLLSITCSALAIVLALAAHKPWSLTAAAAMGLSTVADGLLAGWPAPLRRLVKNRLYTGGAIFLLVQLLYLLSLLRAADASLQNLFAAAPAPFFVYPALCAVHWLLCYRLKHSERPPADSVAVTLYLCVVGLHAAAAASACTLTDGRLALPAAGAAFFFLSDAVLLGRRYGKREWQHSTELIWGTYLIAQACLMLGFYWA